MSKSPRGPSRRTLLSSSAAAAATAACGPRPSADTGADTGTEPGRIDHVIFVMMENRSFDHWLGGMALTEDHPSDGLTEAMTNPSPEGEAIGPRATEEPCPHDPPHSWNSSHAQWNDGAMDGFVTEYAKRTGDDGAGVMEYQRRQDIPFTMALADAYSVCDRWFCSVMSSTWPNRLYAHMASSQGQTGNDFPDGETSFTDRSIWQALEEKGLEWGYYYADLPFIGLLKGHMASEGGRTELMEQFAKDVANGKLPPVSWVDPAFSYNDNHPPHHPGLGELFLGQVYETLAASGLWDRCLLIITYDEHGGFYDHVAPPTIDDDHADKGFDQLGFRVPTLMIGPWVKQGVDSTVYDHASWIKLVCELHDIEPWNARLRATNSAMAGIDTDRMAAGTPLPPVELPAFDFDPDSVGEECFYGRVAHLHKLAEVLKAQGVKLRLSSDPRAVRSPFLREWQRRGLIG